MEKLICVKDTPLKGRGVFAVRDIQKDEEVTFNYSIIINDDWVLECLCGSPICRKIIGKYRARYFPYGLIIL